MAWETLTEEERRAVLKALREGIAADLYPLSPRIRRLKSALAKLDRDSVPAPRPVEPRPPTVPYKPSLLAQRKARRRVRRG